MGSGSLKSIVLLGTQLILLGLEHRTAIHTTRSDHILYGNFCSFLLVFLEVMEMIDLEVSLSHTFRSHNFAADEGNPVEKYFRDSLSDNFASTRTVGFEFSESPELLIQIHKVNLGGISMIWYVVKAK